MAEIWQNVSFLHNDDGDNTAAKAIAIAKVFSENSPAKNACYQHFHLFQRCFQTSLSLCIRSTNTYIVSFYIVPLCW